MVSQACPKLSWDTQTIRTIAFRSVNELIFREFCKKNFTNSREGKYCIHYIYRFGLFAFGWDTILLNYDCRNN